MDAPRYYQPDGTRPFDPQEIFRDCVESGASSLLLDAAHLSPAFFDLASGLAGELLHKLSTYRMKLAVVVPDLEARPARFQELAREANAGDQFRFFADRVAAVAWLESEPSDG